MNAAELAKASVQMSQAADRMKPAENDQHANARNLIVYHLRMAARLSRELAEAMPK